MKAKITLSRTESIMMICNVIMLALVMFACGIALGQHNALVLAAEHRIIQSIPASDRTNYSTLNTNYEKAR